MFHMCHMFGTLEKMENHPEKLMNESHSWTNNTATPPPAVYSCSQHVHKLNNLHITAQNKQQKSKFTPNMQMHNNVSSPYQMKQYNPDIHPLQVDHPPAAPPAVGTETQSCNITQLTLLINLSIYRLWLCVAETVAVNAAVAGGQSFMSDISPLTHSQAN